MRGNGERFTLDQMLADCEIIRNYCLENECEENDKLCKDIDRMLKSAKLIEKEAPNFFFEGLPANGFITYLRIVTAYINKLAGQIEKKNKIDPDLLRLFQLLFDSEEWVLELANDLKNEHKTQKKSGQSDEQHLLLNRFCLGSKHAYKINK